MADNNKRKLIVTDEAVLAVLIQLEKDGEIELTGEAGLAEGGDFRATDKLLNAESPVDAGVDKEDEEDEEDEDDDGHNVLDYDPDLTAADYADHVKDLEAAEDKDDLPDNTCCNISPCGCDAE
jgi:hypothetical protein